ncbi:MAG TPA: sulfurtransferase TusA family protein [Candidatus Krumholzibacteria bacterium]|nr:sulfurtransferase TusA family protein [Candidatus Krumholzibacteria bacterium]HPD72681.1 sulfurtransferase TusA family protein [Candidatus Krumholzibacteria bacterium]HRY40387.1 sulfurtransferase TusA family protein [Candidatus Krumholzibacteria bacterium]
MSKQVDTRGLSCPQPVVLVLRAIQQGDQMFEVLLDSEVACENVRRLLGSRGFRIEETQAADGTVFQVSR